MSERAQHRPLGMLLTRNFPPLQGGMERLNQQMLDALGQQWEMILCGPAGASKFVSAGVRVCEVPIRPLWRFVATVAWQAVQQARRMSPRFVLAGSGLTAPMAWLAARLSGGRAGVYLHGLDLIVPNRLYQTLWMPFLRRCDFVLANSVNTARIARERGVPADRITVLHPGVALPVVAPATDDYRRSMGLGQAKLLVSVGRLSPRKGLAEFVTHCLPAIVAADPRVQLIVVGDEPLDALHAGGAGQRARIEHAAEAVGVGSRVRFAGRCDDPTLEAIYRAADVHVFPVRDMSGDVEGFGMVAIEAAAHGVPTVAFGVGGVPEAVLPGRSGELVSAGDYRAFTATVLRWLDKEYRDAKVDDCRRFASTFAWPEFGKRLRACVSRETAR